MLFNNQETVTNTKNFFWRAMQLASRQGITFFILFISAKLLPKEDFGIYNYIVAIAFFFTLLADFGISRAVTKYVAQYNIENPDKVKRIYFNAAIIILTLVLIFSTVFLFFAETIVGENYRFVYYLFPVFIFLPLTALFDGVYSGLKQFKKLSIISLISGVLTIVATYFLILEYGIIGAFLSLNFYYLVSFILFTATYNLFTFSFDKIIIKDVGRYSLIIGVSALGHFLYSKGITYVLGQYNFFVEVGYYEIIDKVFVMLSFPFIIYGQVIAPEITENITRNNNSDVLKRLKKILLVTVPLTLVLTLVVWQILPLLINRFLNQYYTLDMIRIFNYLLLHLPLLLISALIAQPFVIATGKAKFSLLTIPFGIVNIVLGIILIEQIGFMGIVYSTVGTSIVNKLLTFYLVYKSLRIKNEITG
ncbi:MAG: oligosaccharide flippase family protein [Ignavibacteriaceae bacterium]